MDVHDQFNFLAVSILCFTLFSLNILGSLQVTLSDLFSSWYM